MKNRTILGVICIVFAIAVMFGVAPLVNKMSASKTNVVRVTADITQGEMITSENIAVVEVGKTGLQENAVTDIKAVIGKYATCDIKSGTNVTVCIYM